MPDRDPVLKALRRHEVPAWWRDAKLGIFVHWTPASVPGFAPVADDVTAMVQSGDPRAMGWSPYTEWYENSLRFPDSPVAAPSPRHLRRQALPRLRGRVGGRARVVGPRRVGAHVRGDRCALRGARDQAPRRVLPVAVGRSRTRAGRVGTAARDVVGELGEAVRAQGLRFGVYYSGGLDWTFEDRPLGAMSDVHRRDPTRRLPRLRGRAPARADRALPAECAVERHRVAERGQAPLAAAHRVLRRGARRRGERPMDAVEPARGRDALRSRAARVVDAGAARQAQKNAGLIPPEPPFYDVRTPEYVSFPTIQREPWECVRGMDHSFGYNAASGPDDFLGAGRPAVVVRRHGEQERQPAAQRRAAWRRRADPGRAAAAAAVARGVARMATTTHGARRRARGCGPTDTTVEGTAVRYTARDEDVFAIVERGAPVFTFPDLAPTPTTEVRPRVRRRRCAWTRDRGRAADRSGIGRRVVGDGPLGVPLPRRRRATAD